MKRCLSLFLCLAVAAVLAGCGRETLRVIDFTADEIQDVTLYQYTVPAQASKKVVTQLDDLQKIVEEFSLVKTSGLAQRDDFKYGSTNTIFVFHLKEGNSFFVSYDGLILNADGESHKVRQDGLTDLWDLPYGKEPVPEQEMLEDIASASSQPSQSQSNKGPAIEAANPVI